MKLIKIIGIIIGSLIVILLLFGWYIGGFSHIAITEKKEEGGYKLIGVNVTGPYSGISKDMENVNGYLKAMGVTGKKGFGIYYDDPKMVPKEKCRSFVGYIIEEKDFSIVSALKPEGLTIDSIPKARSLVAEFPIRNSVSYMVGPMKVYPAFSEYMNRKGYKPGLTFEIYDIPARKISFIIQY